MPHLIGKQSADNPSLGKVYLVGAGPGDPGLLTLRGCELLRRGDVVFYDYLVNPLVLRHATAEAQCICLGSHSQGRLMSQAEINAQVIAQAKAGKQVVRLKGGDPSIFGRAAEEIAALEAAGVSYEVVPGITTALAASSHAGIPLTHRHHASCVAFVTGQQCRDKGGAALDLANLARFPGTLVFYMGVTTAPDWAASLVAHGKSPSTPVAIVRHCSLSEQHLVQTTLGKLPEVLAPGKMRPPAILIVGDVVAAQPNINWFTSRPLFGRRLLVTRPIHQSNSILAQLTELGASALIQPAIEIAPVADPTRLDTVIQNLPSYDWLVFSSANGVHYFFERLFQQGHDVRQLGSCQLAAMGPATSEALAEYQLQADLQPEEYRAEALAEQLVPAADGQRVLLLRASRGREVLAETLTAAGITTEQVVVYQSHDIEQSEPDVAAALAAGKIDWVTVTSSAIARSLVRMFGDALHQAQLAAISPLTAEVLSRAGFPPAVVAKEYTVAGLLQAIVEASQE